MMWRFIASFILLGGLSLSACLRDTESSRLAVGTVEGLRPIYSQDWQDIRSLDPRPVGKLGKIYYKDSIIYVIESGWGVHVIDNANPAQPQRIKFLQIPGCRDVAIKGNILYADNVTDLLAIDITDLDNIVLLKRIEDLYPDVDQESPESYEGYFECADPAKGVIVGWEAAMLDNPQCWQ